MADLGTPGAGLARRVSAFAAYPADAMPIGGVGLSEAGPASRFVLRGEQAGEAAGTAFGTTIPTRPMTAATGAGRAALWLGPDEWLLIGPPEDGDAIQSGLAQALAGTPHSLVDVSHRQAGLIVAGPGAALALNAAVPLDLATEAFPVGMCTRTMFEKAEIVLWRTDDERFHVEVWRSFVPYVRDLLHAVRMENAVSEPPFGR